MFDSLASCSCRSTPPTVSSSSSRRDRARSPRRRRRGALRARARSRDARALAARRRRRGRRQARLGRRESGSQENTTQTAIEEAELVVLDLGATGSRQAVTASARSAPSASGRSRSSSRSRRSSLPARSPARRPAHRHPPVRPPRRRRARRPPCALPRVRRRCAAGRAQRAVRPRVPRPGGRTADRSPRRGAGLVDGLAREAAPAGPAAPRFSLLQLAHFFGTSAQPCHRALPDALATAEILVALLGLAQERGRGRSRTSSGLAAPRARRLHGNGR